jgi:hypothetical protein
VHISITTAQRKENAMNILTLNYLVNSGNGGHLLDAETILIPSNTENSDELTTEKVRQCIDMAWYLIEQRNTKKGLPTKNDQSLKQLIRVFDRWVETSEVEDDAIWK